MNTYLFGIDVGVLGESAESKDPNSHWRVMFYILYETEWLFIQEMAIF